MTESEEIIKKRTNKVLHLFKDPLNIILLGILIFAFLIRFYYLDITKEQTLWWDGLAYAAIAKTFFLTGVWSDVPTNVIYEILLRPPLLPFFWGILMKIGFNEIMSKFILEFIPSFLSVFLIYLIGKNMYNKKIGLIAAFILSVSWMHLFYSIRILTEVPPLFFTLISIYYFFKSEKLDSKYFALSIFSLSLAVLMKFNYGLIGITYILYLIFTEKLYFLKNKSFWIGGIVGSIPLLIFAFFNLIKWGSPFTAFGVYATTAEEQTSYAFYTFGFINYILQTPFIFIFIFGLALVLIQVFLGFDLILKIKKLRFNLFLILLFIITLGFFIFWLKNVEDRYLFIAYPSIILITSLGIDSIYNFLKKYSKPIAVIIILGILIFGAYFQIKFADALINEKKSSFMEMKKAFLWLKENAPKDSVVLGEGVDFYTIYYANLIPQSWPSKPGPVLNYYANLVPSSWPKYVELKDYSITADYIVHDVFHGNSKEVQQHLLEIQSQLTPVYAEYFDKERQNPAVIIFKYAANNSNG